MINLLHRDHRCLRLTIPFRCISDYLIRLLHLMILIIHHHPIEVVINFALQLIFDLLLHGVSYAFLFWYLTHFWQGAHLKLDSGPYIIDIWRGSSQPSHTGRSCHYRRAECRLLYVY